MSQGFISRGCRGASRSVGLQRFLPRASTPSASFAQVVSVELDVDASTTVVDPAFATLLSLPITTSGGDLLMWFTAAVHSSAGVLPEFRLLLDGTLLASASTILLIGVTNSVAIFWRSIGVVAGAHTITVEWSKVLGEPAATFLLASPVTLPNREHVHIVAVELPA